MLASSRRREQEMKVLIVCVSVSNGNTRRVADAMADVLDARVIEPDEVDDVTLAESDLVGVGSGIYAMDFHPRIRAFVRRLPQVTEKPAFVYWTSGGPEPPLWRYSRRLARRLEAKGFQVLGSFSCRGWDTWLPLRIVGGLNKGRPNDDDLARARRFATEIRDRMAERPEQT
jgi:flavodoxin